MKNILGYSHIEARAFFLKEESYVNFDLPKYIEFQDLLDNLSNQLEGHRLSDYYETYDITKEDGTVTTKPKFPKNFEGVNYLLLNNKDGRFAWRPFQIIHPALYVSLVHIITEENNWTEIVDRFAKFQSDPAIQCHSVPVESDSDASDKAETVTNWWHSIEQQSIELALDYSYILHTDITDCYGSIYTHSIAWALHEKDVAKEKRGDKSLIGNVIDNHLQWMAFGQTNGIPQGSVLMDFVAEMVLGYADLELSRRVASEDLGEFHIIRYRDDYRIFTNNPQDAELIAKHITEIMIDLGMRLNAQKTKVSDSVVQSSIKEDKLFWMLSKKGGRSLQEHLLVIHALSKKYPNSGSLNKALDKFYDRIQGISKTEQNIFVLVSILVDIIFRNPRTYPIATAILSKFLSLIEDDDSKEKILVSIDKRFSQIPNIGYLQIWLQRITLKTDRGSSFTEPLCQKVAGSSVSLWNSDWLKADFKNVIETHNIVQEDVLEQISNVITAEEVQLFDTKTGY